MKKLSLFMAIMCVFAAESMAQSAKFGVQLTAANISVGGPLKDVYGTGWGGGAHLDISLPVLFSFRLQGDLVMFSPDQGKYREVVAGVLGGAASGFSIDGGNIRIWSIHANTKMNFLPLPIISPYATGGVGFANMSRDEATVKFQGAPVQNGSIPSVAAETNFSANLGAGVDLKLGIELYLEVRYTWIFTKGATSTYIPVSLGITL